MSNELPEGTPARMPGTYESGFHHKPASNYFGLWKAVCGETCFSFPNVRHVRANFVPCPNCPPDQGAL